MSASRRSPTVKVLRSYGPLMVVTTTFLVMLLGVQPVARKTERASAAARGAVTSGVVATGTETPGAATAGATTPGAAAGAAPVVTGCPDRKAQVPGDPYSP